MLVMLRWRRPLELTAIPRKPGSIMASRPVLVLAGGRRIPPLARLAGPESAQTGPARHPPSPCHSAVASRTSPVSCSPRMPRGVPPRFCHAPAVRLASAALHRTPRPPDRLARPPSGRPAPGRPGSRPTWLLALPARSPPASGPSELPAIRGQECRLQARPVDRTAPSRSKRSSIVRLNCQWHSLR